MRLVDSVKEPEMWVEMSVDWFDEIGGLVLLLISVRVSWWVTASVC